MEKAQTQQPEEHFKRAAVDVARLFDLADVESWDQLPDGVRKFMLHVEYRALIVPLVYRDRCEMSWAQLAIKYRLTVQEVRTICKKAYYRANVYQKRKKAR